MSLVKGGVAGGSDGHVPSNPNTKLDAKLDAILELLRTQKTKEVVKIIERVITADKADTIDEKIKFDDAVFVPSITAASSNLDSADIKKNESDSESLDIAAEALRKLSGKKG